MSGHPPSRSQVRRGRFIRLAWLPLVGLVGAPAMAADLSAGSAPAPLPWIREIPLREAARSQVIEGELDPSRPSPGFLLNNPEIKASLWGPARQITLSLIKTDVFDRRYGTAPWPTLADIRAGAFSPANRGFDDMPPGRRRPVRGYLLPSGGRTDPSACWNAYPFPCQKPVGQIILGFDELAGAEQPDLVQRCSDGRVRFQVRHQNASADLEVLLTMTSNVYAVHGTLKGIQAPWVRVYRHLDQAYRQYMSADGRSFLKVIPNATAGEAADPAKYFDYAKDAAWNGPVAPPESGNDGRFFWIHQRLPAEKTFPQGFDYVLMGVVGGSGQPAIKTADGQHGLGTPAGEGSGEGGIASRSPEAGYAFIRAAPGSAATATLTGGPATELNAYFVVVTANESADPVAEARRRLEAAQAAGFEGLARENAAWLTRVYDERENGRVFYGDQGSAATESIPAVYRSWYTRHGGVGLTDARHYQASASYAEVERDAEPWKSLPCYNELFYTPWAVRHRSDALDMWWQLLEEWLPAARQNARDTYGMPGMMLVHGYLPPVKPDTYVHSTVALEYSLDTAAQVVKVPWDQWDYSGDVDFLRAKVYPPLRDLAIFYAAYAQKGKDGFFHVIPAIEAEAWGIFPEFKRGQDTISSLCMFRWAFLRAAEAAEVLGVDPELRAQWRAMADRMAPYPVYPTPAGLIFNTVNGTVPSWKRGDHPWYAGVYPTTLADEITLDSSPALREQMIRTANSAPAAPNAEVLVLLGACPETVASLGRGRARPITTLDELRAEIDRFPERLLNSRSGRIHLFPCVPGWATLGFRRFQARGGFLVSATKDRAGIRSVEIEARRDGPCQVMNPWPGRPAAVRDTASGRKQAATLDVSNGECVVFQAAAGESYQIVREK